MLFRWEKYRFVLVMISFSAFHFSTIIAVCESGACTINGVIYKEGKAIFEPTLKY